MTEAGDAGEKLCVITGTSSGIGLSLAGQLLAGGWRVIGIARRNAPLEHKAYTHLHLDLSDLKAVRRTVETEILPECVKDNVGRVGLVNNAALLDPVVPMTRLPLEDLQRATTVNLVVPQWLMGLFSRACAGKSLRMVNISSGAARNPRGGWGAYCATKAGLLMAGRVWGAEGEVASPAGDASGTDQGAAPGTPRLDAALFSFEPGVVDTAMQTQIRGFSPDEFPSVERFVAFHAEGKLKSPDVPAGEIAAFLNNDETRGYSETRLG